MPHAPVGIDGRTPTPGRLSFGSERTHDAQRLLQHDISGFWVAENAIGRHHRKPCHHTQQRQRLAVFLLEQQEIRMLQADSLNELPVVCRRSIAAGFDCALKPLKRQTR